MKTFSVLILGLTLAGAVAAAQAPPVNDRAKVLADFKKRVDAYADLRAKADNTTPPLKKTSEPADIHVAEKTLGVRIREMRANAKQGDIFTPEIASELKRLMHPEVKEKGTKELMKEDKPMPVPFKVNGEYPDKLPLVTSPPNVLENLPTLPKDIEYRFVKNHLILFDAKANLIVDYILNALP